jgi:spermidine/putrescine transport system ATP-binding protein
MIVDGPRDGGNVLRGRVQVATFLGVSLQYVVRTQGGDELTVIEQNREGAHRAVAAGQEVLLAWEPEHTFVVPKEQTQS